MVINPFASMEACKKPSGEAFIFLDSQVCSLETNGRKKFPLVVSRSQRDRIEPYFIKFIIFIIFCFISGVSFADDNPFHKVYPLNGFKVVVDTCMRSYSDALLLQDRISNHEKCDELLDLLVGRLIRLQSYIEQLIYAYKYEATVSFDELDYLMRMLDYLEITLSDQTYQEISSTLNHLANQLKRQLKDALGIISYSYFTRVPALPYQSLPLVIPSHQFA